MSARKESQSESKTLKEAMDEDLNLSCGANAAQWNPDQRTVHYHKIRATVVRTQAADRQPFYWACPSTDVEKNSRNFRVSREMREKICVIRPVFGRILNKIVFKTQN